LADQGESLLSAARDHSRPGRNCRKRPPRLAGAESPLKDEASLPPDPC